MNSLILSFVLSFLSAFLITNSLAAEVVLLMPFDEGSGTMVTDSSGNGNHGKVEGKVEWVKGKHDNALKFDGATTHITVPKTPSLSQLSETISVGAWVNLTALSGWTNLVEMDAWKVGFRDANPVFTLYGIKDYIATGSVKISEWSHVAYTYDGKLVQIYINGKLDTEIPVKKADRSLSPGMRLKGKLIGIFRGAIPSMNIGWRGIAKSSYLNATIDDLWVSTDIMSAEEIQKLMQGSESLMKR